MTTKQIREIADKFMELTLSEFEILRQYMKETHGVELKLNIKEKECE